MVLATWQPLVARWQNKASKTAEVLIYGDIGNTWLSEGVTAKDLKEALDNLGDVQTINVRVNSPGGLVLEAQAIYNTLTRHPARIEVDIDGAAYSAASWIVQAGDVRRMAENARMMIHEAQGGMLGTAADLRREADFLDSLSESIAGVYASRSGRTVAQFREAMAVETVYAPADALAVGLIDEITANKTATAYKLCDYVEYRNRKQLEEASGLTHANVVALSAERAQQIRAFQVSRGMG